MASIHLYDLTSVAATLLSSIQSNSVKLAVSACSELVESGCQGMALSICRLGLALSPFSSLSPIIMLSTDIPVVLGAALSVSPYELPERRTPPLGPLVYTTKTVPWIPKSVANHTTIWVAIKDALKHKRAERAAFLALSVKEDADLITLLASFDIDAAYANWLPLVPRERVLLHAFSSYGLTTTITTKPISLRTPFPLGKAGRTFTVPTAALETWGLNAPPLSCLMGDPVWVALNPCPTLQPIITKCGIVGTQGSSQPGGTATGIIARDDDALEEFYSTVFPDDIPDEWSVLERSKSHGQQGIVQRKNPWISVFQALVKL